MCYFMAYTNAFLCDVICMNIATQALQPKHRVCCDIARISLFAFPLIPSHLHKVTASCFTCLVTGTVLLLGIGSCESWNPLGQSSQSYIYRLFIRASLFALLLRNQTVHNNFFSCFMFLDQLIISFHLKLHHRLFLYWYISMRVLL